MATSRVNVVAAHSTAAGIEAQACVAQEKFQGGCHCGTVQFETEGLPEWVAICHCSLCRRCHSGPYAELVAYKPSNVRITHGEEALSMYNVDGKSKEDRHFCNHCGARVYSFLNQVPNGGMKAVFLQNFTSPNHGADGQIDPRFKPQCHIFYGSGTVSCYDGLPKFEAKRGGNELAENFHDER